MTQPFATVRATARRAYVAIGCLAVVSAAGLLAPDGAQAAPAPPAQLSISLTDGVTQVRSNTDVDYVTKVTNNGTSPVSAELVLATSAYVTIMHAAGAKVAAHTATWRITVRPGSSVSRPAAAHIGTIVKGEYRVTALASLYHGKATGGVPLIRTAVANTIAGVKDPAGTVNGPAPHRAATSGSSSTTWLLFAGGTALAVVVLALTALLWRRRRRTAREATSPVEAGIAAPVHPVAEPPAQPVTTPAAAPERETWSKRPRPTPVAVGRHHAEESE